eukprot:TRINITY_DN25578_c0_g1_i12.p1 TRINITY_DN25578_c0_g1~~TRINITY_DN25578_c0_g1_i12.p1  ORF type:complete len:396 (+),score=55.93 TRINITY_DN25578_c0_g1_i12:181-1368(+)
MGEGCRQWRYRVRRGSRRSCGSKSSSCRYGQTSWHEVLLELQEKELIPQSTASQASSGPLQGIRVVDLASVISGPWATSFLADQGADVIKVEDPKGPDLTRGLGPNPGSGMAAMFVTCNRGKRGVTLDLQQPRGLEVLKRLVKKSDVVVMNYRPGVAERLGCDYAALSEVNPNIIVLSISGFGSAGPYADLKVYDQVVQAMSGLPSIMSDKSGKPTMFHNTVCDKVCALNACQAITSALLAREKGQGGQHIELNMMDSLMHFLFPDAYWNRVWCDTKPIPVEWRTIAQNSEYDVADGKVTITATDYKQMSGLLRVAGLQELIDKSVGKMRADTVQEIVDPKGGRFRAVRPPARFSRTPSAIQGPAPRMGADSAAVLRELGQPARRPARLQPPSTT